LSGDLGNAGRLAELVERLAPRVSPERHGLAVGNNLLKAYLDLRRPGPARALLDALFAQGRPDWRQTLDFLAVQISRLGIERQKAQAPSGPPIQTTMLEFTGPLWTRSGSPFAGLLPASDPGSVQIAFLGGTVLYPKAGVTGAQLSDPPGRFSRALPLYLSEQLRLDGGAATVALLPWVTTQGFGVYGVPLSDPEACQLARRSRAAPGVLCSLVLDTTSPETWRATARCLGVGDGRLLSAFTAYILPEELRPATDRFVLQPTERRV